MVDHTEDGEVEVSALPLEEFRSNLQPLQGEAEDF
jgi:hypothetical protein